MGTSKRYAHAIDAQMDRRVLEGIMRTGAPETLGPAQLELDQQPITKPPHAREGRAWVRYGEHVVQIDVEIVAWTDRACAVRWPGPSGQEHRAWVWASAVTLRTK